MPEPLLNSASNTTDLNYKKIFSLVSSLELLLTLTFFALSLFVFPTYLMICGIACLFITFLTVCGFLVYHCTRPNNSLNEDYTTYEHDLPTYEQVLENDLPSYEEACAIEKRQQQTIFEPKNTSSSAITPSEHTPLLSPTADASKSLNLVNNYDSFTDIDASNERTLLRYRHNNCHFHPHEIAINLKTSRQGTKQTTVNFSMYAR